MSDLEKKLDALLLRLDDEYFQLADAGKLHTSKINITLTEGKLLVNNFNEKVIFQGELDMDSLTYKGVKLNIVFNGNQDE